MTDFDLPPEAVEAAARAICENTDEPGWSAVVIARAALTAALSHIVPTLPSTEAVEAACRATHPVRWEYPATAHPCDDCTTAVTAAGPIIAAEARERVAREIEARVRGEALLPDESTNGRTIRILREDGLTEAARIARGEGS